jgi:hypothetical protein
MKDVDRSNAIDEGLANEYKDELDVLRRKERLTTESTNPQYMTVVFNGEYDRDILTYPELLSKTESTEISTLCERVRKFTDSIDRKRIERENQIDSSIYSEMSKLKLYGMTISDEFGKTKVFHSNDQRVRLEFHLGGLGFNSQASVRIFEELAVSPTITTQLLAHAEYGVRSKSFIYDFSTIFHASVQV